MQSSSKRLLVKEFDELASDTAWEESTPDVLLVKALKESSSEIEAIELAEENGREMFDGASSFNQPLHAPWYH